MLSLKGILMGREMFFVEEHQVVADVARKMAGLHVGAILVLRNGTLTGIFSERDLMTRVVVEGRDIDRTSVSDVMTRQPATIQENASIAAAMEMMHEHGCRHLPVVNGDQVVGMVSMRDLMNYELDRKTQEIEQMRAYIHGAA